MRQLINRVLVMLDAFFTDGRIYTAVFLLIVLLAYVSVFRIPALFGYTVGVSVTDSNASVSRVPAHNYSFWTFYNELPVSTRLIIPYCAPSSWDSSTVATCANTGSLPTQAQSMLWQSYVFYYDCNELHSQPACAELDN